MINDDILIIAKQANLSVFRDGKVLSIKPHVSIAGKLTLSGIIFLSGGLLLIIMPFIMESDITSRIIGIVLGLLFVVGSLLIMLQQAFDRVQIKDNTIYIYYRLKRRRIPINAGMKIKMKTGLVSISRVGSPGSEFIVVTLMLEYQNTEIPVLDFQMNNSDADNAIRLGKELTRILNAAI